MRQAGNGFGRDQVGDQCRDLPSLAVCADFVVRDALVASALRLRMNLVCDPERDRHIR
jgi:hypothetical protein